MTTHRSIHVLLLVTIAFSTCGCSTTMSVDLDSDPSDSLTRARFEAGEAVEIEGYTRVSDGHRDWKGFVQLAPPDSVQFTSTSKRQRHEFRILRSDLASIDCRGVDTRVLPAPAPSEASPALVGALTPAGPAQQPGAAVGPSATDHPAISVVPTSPGGMSERSKRTALTVGIFVAVVSAVAIGYGVAGEY